MQIFFMLLTYGLIGIGLLGKFNKKILYAYLPESSAFWCVQNWKILVIIGIVLAVLGMVFSVIISLLHHKKQQHTLNEFKNKHQQQNQELYNAVNWQQNTFMGGSFANRELILDGQQKLFTKQTSKDKKKFIGFLFITILLVFIFVLGLIASITKDGGFIFVILPLAGAVVFGVGTFLLINKTQYAMDKSLNKYWQGQPYLKHVDDIEECEQQGNIKDIVAIQLLCKENTSSSSSIDPDGNSHSTESRTKGYELNLVCNNGERVTILNHGDAFRMLADTEKLAEFLALPIMHNLDDNNPDH